MSQRTCTDCKETKSLSEFWRRSATSSGMYNQCKACCSRKKSAYRSKHRDTYRRKNRAWARALRQEVLAAYGNKCACCGERRQEFLALDHVNGDGAAHRRRVGEAGKIYMDVKRRGFPPEFRLLCHNCNQSRGYYGYCPHENEKQHAQTYGHIDSLPERTSAACSVV